MRRGSVAAPLLLAATLSATGCAMWPFNRMPSAVLMRADGLAEKGDYSAAVAAYDEFLTSHADDTLAPRALASRDNAAAIVTARDEVARLRQEVLNLRDELARRESELVRVRQELAARQADADRLRMSLERLKEIDLKKERGRR